jgi:hypothetical protein
MEKSNFVVKITPIEKNIYSAIEGNFLAETKYFFYLLKDGLVIDRHGWLSTPEHSWNNLNPGRYQVRGFYQSGNIKKNKFSETVIILDEGLDSSWSDLSKKGLDFPDLLFSPSPLPHQDILVLHDRAEPRDLVMPGFVCREGSINKKIKIFHQPKTEKCHDLFFSGSAFYQDRLIFGQEEARCVDNILDLLDSNGDFFSVFQNENQTILTNDYFGVQKIFYFQNNEIFLASNRVHLLLLGMAIAKVDFEMDPAMVRATLASGYIQPFQQIFSHDLMVKGVKLLPIDKRVVITKDFIDFEPKPISDLLAENLAPARDLEYENLIKKGIADIIQQANAVINHPGFKNIVFDATGGMDSRVILAAASSCDKQDGRVSINAMNTVSIPLDIRVACEITSMLGFEHDNSPEKIEVLDSGYHKIQAISQLLGTYFAYDIRSRNGEMATRESAINVTGFFGEICLRPYYSRSYTSQIFADSEFDGLEREDFYEFLLQENRSNLLNPSAKIGFQNLWIKSVQTLPGANPVEKYDLHYLFYRNGLHFSDIFRMKWNTPRVGILQSKNLFLLKRKLFSNSPKTLLQNEVIYRINSKLLSIPYASNRDNEDLKEALIFFKTEDPITIKENINELESGNRAVNARQSKKITKLNIESPRIGEIDLAAIAEHAVFNLSEHSKLIEPDFGKEILTSLKSDAFPWVIMNKVLMAYYMFSLTKISSEEAGEILKKSLPYPTNLPPIAS